MLVGLPYRNRSRALLSVRFVIFALAVSFLAYVGRPKVQPGYVARRDAEEEELLETKQQK